MIITRLGIESVQTRFKSICKDNMVRLMAERPELMKGSEILTVKANKKYFKNTRSSRMEHLDFSIEDLLVRKCHFHLNQIEIPKSTKYNQDGGKSYSLFLIPGARQYLNSVTVIMT